MIASIVGVRLPKNSRSLHHSLIVSRASAAVSVRLTSGRTTRLASDLSRYSERTDGWNAYGVLVQPSGVEVLRSLALE